MMRAGQCSLICACALYFIVFVSSSVDAFESEGTYYYDELGGVYYQPQLRQDENVRGKRTLGIFLKSFADAIGYDVQKRPSVFPIGGAPVAAAPAAMAPAPAAPGPAAPAAPAPGKPGIAAPPPPAPRAPAPKAPPPPPPPAPPAPPAKPAPAAPPAKPAPAAPAPAPAMPAAPAPKPAAPRPPTAPPLLTETIQKMFNINFNWNRNLQPKMPVAPAPAPAAPGPAPKAPPAAPPAAAAPAAPSAPAPNPPPAAPAAPAAPPAPPAAPAPKGPPTKAPPTRYYQDLQENDYLDYPDRQQQIIYYPDENESLNQEDTKEVRNDYGFPEAIQQYWTQSPWNKNNIQYNLYTPAPDYQEFNTPDGGRGYHVRHYHRNDHLLRQEQPHEEQNPEQQQQAPESNEQEQYQPQPEQQQQQQQQEPQPEQKQQQQPQPEQQQYQQNNEDVNGDDTRSYYKYNDYQPRGFQPVYSGSESRYQNNYFQPGLPLQIHGIEKDKVLVAWPAPFELAGSEKKNKITPYNNNQFGDRMQSSGSENQEYKYEPESYGEYNFYTIPPPTKYQYEKYDAPPSDPNIEKNFSEKAKVSETNYSKKYTNVNADRNTYVH